MASLPLESFEAEVNLTYPFHGLRVGGALPLPRFAARHHGHRRRLRRGGGHGHGRRGLFTVAAAAAPTADAGGILGGVDIRVRIAALVAAV